MPKSTKNIEEVLTLPRGFDDLYHEVIKKDKCSVCGACIISCPKNLLDVREALFFEHPQVDSHLPRKEVKRTMAECINCNLCYDVCPEIKFDIKTAEKAIKAGIARLLLSSFNAYKAII